MAGNMDYVRYLSMQKVNGVHLTVKIDITVNHLIRSYNSNRSILVLCALGLHNFLMHEKYLMSSMAENPAKDFQRICLQWDQV